MSDVSKLDDEIFEGVSKQLGVDIPVRKTALPPKPKLIDIVTFPHQALETECRLVTQEECEEMEKLAERMLEAMRAEQGWGLAANQVADTRRMFVMEVPYRFASDDCRIGNVYAGNHKALPFIFVNPLITGVSEEQGPANEGCLSFPGVTERIVRPLGVRLVWTDVHSWKIATRDFTGWEARVIQHEYDHLNGRSLIDHLSPVAQKKMRKRALAGRRL